MSDGSKWTLLVSGAIAGAVVTGAVLYAAKFTQVQVQGQEDKDSSHRGPDEVEEDPSIRRKRKGLSHQFSEMMKNQDLRSPDRRSRRNRPTSVDTDSSDDVDNDNAQKRAATRPKAVRHVEFKEEDTSSDGIILSPGRKTPSITKQWIQDRYIRVQDRNLPSRHNTHDSEQFLAITGHNPAADSRDPGLVGAGEDLEETISKGEVTVCSEANTMGQRPTAGPTKRRDHLIRRSLLRESMTMADEPSGIDSDAVVAAGETGDGDETSNNDEETDVDGDEHLVHIPKSPGKGQALHVVAAQE
eukprot:CAMPEP_0118953528 /NCGR_PEP_ID=MMETSP1169-20130426/56725_1 /TAXON_ID=36882 /ORGANISM="Pyramimonas obovata, Strain CCMP722" /LENGTH=299 /DNA_ID=CAMNT_0006901013 /DNA_START=238 /DNA_END=1134 /DNA_ORIENTATION=+